MNKYNRFQFEGITDVTEVWEWRKCQCVNGATDPFYTQVIQLDLQGIAIVLFENARKGRERERDHKKRKLACHGSAPRRHMYGIKTEEGQ